METSEIEKIQRRATKMIKNIKDHSYSERLLKLGLPTLEYRRRRADMIETFKIIHGIHGIDKVDKNKVFSFNMNKIRGHEYKIFKKTM